MSSANIESERPDHPMRWGLLVAAGVVAAITIVAYLPCLNADFVDWDDDKNIVGNTNFRGLAPGNLIWMFTTTHMGPYQPLSWLTLGMDYVVWGLNPRGYHLTNILLHAAGAGVLCLLTASILTRCQNSAPRPTSSLGVTLAAATAALAWALHPQHVESVAWVTERRDVLSGLLYLLCIWSYLQAHRSGLHEGTHHWWLRLATAFCGLALLAKATAVSIPVVLLILDIYPLGRLTGRFWTWHKLPQRRLIVEKFLYVLFSVLAVLVGFLGQFRSDAIRSLDEVGLTERLAIVGHAIAFYVSKAFWPVDLAPLYPRPEIIQLTQPRFFLACLGVVALSAILILLRRRMPGVLAAWVCYVLALMPVSGLITIGDELVADRYSYLPTLSLFVLLGGVFLLMWQSARTRVARVALRGGAVVLASGIVLALGWHSCQIIPIWHDSMALWTRGTERRPKSHKAWNNFGASLEKLGRHDEAERAYRKAIEQYEDYATGHYNLGITLMRTKRLADAAVAFGEATRLDPTNALAHANLGAVLTWLGKPEQAIPELQQALKLNPGEVPSAHYQLGEAYRELRQFDKAAAKYREAAKATPNGIAPLVKLADVCLSLRQIDEAESVAIKVVAAKPGQPGAHYAMAQVRAQQERFTEALWHLRKALTNYAHYRDRVMEDRHLRELRLEPKFHRMMRSLPDTKPAKRKAASRK